MFLDVFIFEVDFLLKIEDSLYLFALSCQGENSFYSYS